MAKTMSRLRSVITILFVLLAGRPVLSAQAVEAWLPVTQADKDIKGEPGGSNSSAIQLYYSFYKDDNDRFISVYRRIKVLTEAGRKYADIEIPLDPDESLKQLKARTIHPDGSIAEFTGQPFEKTIIKGQGIKYVAKTFALPDVTVGSIVEYSYVTALPRGFVLAISEWPIQHDLYTVRERLRFRAWQGPVNAHGTWRTAALSSGSGKTEVAYSYLNQTDPAVPQKKKGNLLELELANVASFHSEEYMPPEGDYKPAIVFYYGGREFVSPEKFWQEWQKLMAEAMEKFIGNSPAVRETALKSIAGETDPEKKLRKLYARAQQIRNLSFERERTKEEEKKENLKPNWNAQDVLEHGYGFGWEIDALFAALARAAGFDAAMVSFSSRQQRCCRTILLSLGKFDGDAVSVNVNGKDVMLDPGTKSCPYALLRWKHTAVTALRLARQGGFFDAPPPQLSPMVRTAKIYVAADGSAKGELTVELRGHEALEHRLDAMATDEAGRAKNFEAEIEKWLSASAQVKMTSSQGWETADDPLIAKFSLELPNFASRAGKRLVVPAILFPMPLGDTFSFPIRIYPFSFPYPFSETDETHIHLPEGFAMETAPYHREAGLPSATYQTSSEFRDGELVTRRSLDFNGFSFPQDKYLLLKGFFDIVQAGDKGQAILQPVAKAAAVHE